MVLDQSGIRKRFIATALAPAPKEQPKEHPAAFKSAFEAASDEKQFLSDLEYVLVSIAALMCCTPQRAALTDERVQRMLLSLQGFSTPYLQSRFKNEAQQVANRKHFMAEQQVRQRPPRSHFPAPPLNIAELLRDNNARDRHDNNARDINSRFFTRRQEQDKKFLEMQSQARNVWETECIVAKSLHAKLQLPAPRPGM